MAIHISDSSSIGSLVVSSSLIASSSIQFVTNSLHIDYGLGQGGEMGFSSFISTIAGGIISASHAEGSGSIATGIFSHAEGEKNTSTKIAHHLEGYNHTDSATLFPLHIEGVTHNLSSGTNTKYVHVEGINNKVGGLQYGHVEGYLNTCSIQSGNGHMSGVNNSSILGSPVLNNSHVKGINNVFRQIENSHIEGTGHNAASTSLRGNHLEGSGSTIAKGYYVHIEGEKNSYNVLNQSNHIKGYSNTITQTNYSNNTTFTTPRNSNFGGTNNDISVKAWSRVLGISHSLFPPIAILNTTFNSQSFAAVFASGYNLRTYNTASEYIYTFGKFNSGLSTGNSSQWYSYITIGGGQDDSNRANIMEIVTNVSGTMGTLGGIGPGISFYPSSSFIILPGIQYYATNAAAQSAGVPVGGLYRTYDKNDDTYNSLAVVY